MRRLIAEHYQYLIKPGKYPGLDLLRAIGVICVVLYHANFYLYGYMAVDLFFVLSGFLIGGILYDQLRNNTWSLQGFYKHRALRILPLYYFFVALCLVVKPLAYLRDLPSMDILIMSVLSSLALLQTTGGYYFGWPIYTQITPGGSWSLCVEELFYLFFPLLLYSTYRLTRGRALPIALIMTLLAISAIGIRYFTMASHPDNQSWGWATAIQFPCRSDEFLAGAIGAVAIRHLSLSIVSKAFLTLFGLSILAVWIASGTAGPVEALMSRSLIWSPTVMSVAFGLIIFGMATFAKVPRIFVVLARISYAIYLLHIIIIEILVQCLHQTIFSGPNSIAPLVLLLAGSYLLSLLVEYPFIRMYKKRQPPELPMPISVPQPVRVPVSSHSSR